MGVKEHSQEITNGQKTVPESQNKTELTWYWRSVAWEPETWRDTGTFVLGMPLEHYIPETTSLAVMSIVMPK